MGGGRTSLSWALFKKIARGMKSVFCSVVSKADWLGRLDDLLQQETILRNMEGFLGGQGMSNES
jgi:hypothetical protein